ncbi:MAG: phosphoenolpyruvate--protein phosphotransferase [Kiritimatiellae bacterium]|nr:phosphoenolpyruvate--protein phosphotransferase [Kiritimatiellia bacterium]
MSDFRKDEVALLWDVSELVGLFDTERGLDAFLAQSVSKIAWHMRAAVCSIYLYEPATGELVLRANQGLAPGAVGKLRLRLDHSLTGQALLKRRPIREARGQDNPHFMYLPELQEDRFQGFLAVPILRRMRGVGVIVVQDPQWNYFTPNDERALQVIAAQLGGVIENAALFMQLNGGSGTPVAERVEEKGFGPGTHTVQGQGAAGRVAVGLATQIGHYLAEDQGRPAGLRQLGAEDFEQAFAATDAQLIDLQGALEAKLHDAASMIFGAHVLMLRDEAFAGQIRARIAKGEDAYEAALAEIRAYKTMLLQSGVSLLKEKVLDVEDLGHRLLSNLVSVGTGRKDVTELPDYSGQIVIARELLPSDILKLSAEGAAALILLSGGQHSHVAILAKALRLPLVIAQDERLLHIPEQTPMLLDGRSGKIIVRPGEEAAQAAREMVRQRAAMEQRGFAVKEQTLTKDGVKISLRANLNLVSELEFAKKVRADGVGLYRTEFPFIVRSSFPTEEEQYLFYKAAIDQMGGRPVVFRTLDIGGDKALSYFPVQHEENPVLGLRALRFSFRNPAIFKTQVRALLRASAGAANARLMFPMVDSIDEFLQARDITYACYRELEKEGTEARLPELGVMVELPAAVWIVEDLAKEADFLSIGSNDLIQYLLAVDRTNESVADFFTPHHPAVLRCLARIVRAGNSEGKDVSLCGDLATDSQLLPFLLGIGLRTLSMDPTAIPRVQQSIEHIDVGLAERQAARMLEMGRVAEVESYLADIWGREPRGKGREGAGQASGQ